MTMRLLANLPLLTLLVLAAITDVRERRIPNWLTLLLIASGVLRTAFTGCAPSPLGSVAGMFAGAALPFVLFAIGALGAGDVKLMAGVGAWLGSLAAVEVFLLAGVAGMFIVLAQAVAQRHLGLLLRNSLVVGLNLLYVREVGLSHATETGRSCRSVERPLPYAVPVLAAVIFAAAALWRHPG